MADIIPFKGTLYNPEKIKDISKATAPPYDVISPEEQKTLYGSDPHNIIRILFGKDMPGDNAKENKYTRAAGSLKEWQTKGVLKKDKEDAIYVYLQEFSIEGQIKRRLGFISLLKLEDFDTKTSSVYPHENTLLAPKEDRTRLISSIEANLGPVFALFADEDRSIDKILADNAKSSPIIDIVDLHGIRNKLWRVSDKAVTREIVRLIKDKKLFIADGHHRYEVGLAFSKTKKDPKYGYILTYFTDLYADGIVVLPVYRLISGLDKDALTRLMEGLRKVFSVEKIDSREKVKEFLQAAGKNEKRFVMYDGKGFTGLKLVKKDSLDVTVLHDLVIAPLRKISIDFTKDMDYAINEVNKGQYSVSVMLNPTRITEIRDMAFAGKRMPQKSTYFYPKVLTGLVINVF
ncbi:MAG: DUF1015 domain-containing protein [Candidatus Omnitrophica bacterium]|nr:DUF1015 domain-containing protein [Candidatus Omnitrophota bacterium]MBU1932958.1 DUF1015 domain-containing protein [Candidatus Omnitrophota bacterium]